MKSTEYRRKAKTWHAGYFCISFSLALLYLLLFLLFRNSTYLFSLFHLGIVVLYTTITIKHFSTFDIILETLYNKSLLNIDPVEESEILKTTYAIHRDKLIPISYMIFALILIGFEITAGITIVASEDRITYFLRSLNLILISLCICFSYLSINKIKNKIDILEGGK